VQPLPIAAPSKVTLLSPEKVLGLPAMVPMLSSSNRIGQALLTVCWRETMRPRPALRAVTFAHNMYLAGTVAGVE
jgi:hypothetical protein